MNIVLFDELESKIKLLAEELNSAKQGILIPNYKSDDSNKLSAIESHVENLILLLDEYEGGSNG
ncbi:MAG: hypothetical protein HQ509_05095 [Candidatus Marinimicrobia bacterium]|nr:hypothetical protein [Candidatus Neomarinimicrobiota bacterium]